jgi:predicted metal-dependent TIM-barrel fold hydrolase
MKTLFDEKTEYSALIERCRKIVKCDVARISKLGKTMYFIIGFNRNTKQDEGQWVKNGQPIDFDYVNEKVIASGETDDELIESIKEHERLRKMSKEKDILTVK